MTLNRALEVAPWRTGDATSQLLLSVAAGRPVRLGRQLNQNEMELAIHHGLFGLMADHDNPHLRTPAIPVFARLEARHGVMRSHLDTILRLLHAARVQATVLKGLHLALAYRNPMHRTTTDVDLLVPAGQVDRALEVLAEYEYVQTIPAKTPKADKRNIPIADPSGVRFTLDLHWDLFSYSQLRGCAAGATDWAWQHATLNEDHPLGPLWELPEEARIAFLCTHALLDHRFRLILFRDLSEVAAAKPDWEALVRFADRFRLRSTTYLALLMAVGLFEAEVPQDSLAALRKRSMPALLTERLLRTTDLVQFDGHRAHPLNLAIVLVHDDIRGRARLLAQAPGAFPSWQARVAREDQIAAPPASVGGSSAPLVLHLLPVDLARGAQTYAKALCAALEDHNANHLTMTIFQSESDPLETDLGLDVTPGRGRRFGFDVRAALALRRALRRMKPAIIVAHGGEPLKYAAVVAPRRAKLVYYKIGTAAGQFKNELRRRLYSRLLRRVDVLAGVSREMVEEAETLQDVPPSRTVYIPNGREPGEFSAATHEPGDVVQFCFIGHLTRTKRPERFVEVIARLRAAGLPATGIMAGDGPLEPAMNEKGPSVGVEVLGRRSDVPQLLAGADAFLFTSLAEGEGMPGVLVEAGLAALPTVATDVPGARTVIEDGETGYVVPIDDLDAFCDAATRLAEDVDLRKRMGEAARRRCLEHFTLEASTEMWRQIFDALLSDSALPALK